MKSSLPHSDFSVSNRAFVLDVAGQHQLYAGLFGKRFDPPPERLALIGERHLGAVLVGFLGDAPGDRMVVRHAHDKAALALHQSFHSAGS
jgi:hypothetical protein